MKEIKSKKQTHFIKKFFIKICRMLGYELIDQSTLEFPVSNKDFQNLGDHLGSLYNQKSTFNFVIN